MLRAGQAAGNILQRSPPFVPAERARQGISQLAVTVEVKRWDRNEQPPILAKRSIFLLLSSRKYLGNLKLKEGKIKGSCPPSILQLLPFTLIIDCILHLAQLCFPQVEEERARYEGVVIWRIPRLEEQ